MLLKRKVPGVPIKEHLRTEIIMPLEQVNVSQNKYLSEFQKKKPYIANELKEWIHMLQPTVKTITFECKYYIQVSFKHDTLFAKKLDPVILPINIFHCPNHLLPRVE